MGGNLTSSASASSSGTLFKAGSGTLTLGGASDSFASFIATGGNILTGNLTITGVNGSPANVHDVFYVADGDSLAHCNSTLIIQPGASLTVNGAFADAGVFGRDGGVATVIQNGGTFTFNMGNQPWLFVGASAQGGTYAEYDMNGGTLDMSDLNLGVGQCASAANPVTATLNQTAGDIINVSVLNLGVIGGNPDMAATI
ncbi:MAG: hypothetical protein WDM76_16510 [Limisphaerales bacterium]